MQPLEAGEPLSIGAYRLLGRLGAGGMGRVYLGRSAGGRTVAVKVVHPHFALDEQFRARFRREVEAARRIGAQWTAPVLDADPDAPVPWVATGYVAGPPLSAAVTEHGPLPEHAVRVLGAGLGEALAAVHERGLIHRDVKPSNVLLALDGPRLIDFGIARAIDATASLTSTGVSVGSPGYMAPEQIRGTDLSGAADVFSLGAVLAYAATGSAPFLGDSSAVLLYKVVHEEPELGELEGPLRETIAACLAKDPARRPTPAELARRLLPGGAAAAVAAGWLPGPLVRQVSRSAVALLDLEPQEAPDRSGPVPFSNPSFGAFTGGPAVPDAGDPQSGAAGGYGAFGPPHPPTAGADGLPGQRTGGRSLTFGATAGGDGAGRRRVSCTLALAVAGALAAVTVGSAFLLDLMPGSGGDTTNVGQGESRPTPSAPSKPSAAATGPATQRPTATPGEAAELPEAFVGTWKGPLTEKTSGQPHGTLTAVFEKGRTGTDVLRLTTSLSLGIEVNCYSVATLTAVSGDELELRERADPDRPSTAGLCTVNPADLHFTRQDDGTLRFRSDEKAAGLPYGTLTRSGG
ncbi:MULTISPECIES: serine/threonine-protein kinase [unclassified Streptomyces]|uniref:serine/threonine-protein kinase n=1 Tax=unclassified Streptomyces TaxID=2593676 RepID=UPI000DAC7384|nr:MULTISPECIES: serine/threonine-protein kinase [unclassified Streptomyces]PZT75945.1 serine/threonine protein kinase [Streptomyces sp. AC1-42W]PZT80104.1 serine/threonine protein kinase [Streptomyces sp. AC1-42T]